MTPLDARQVASAPAAVHGSSAAHIGAVASLIALCILSVAWEAWLAPLAPGSWKLALKAVPLLVPLAGVIRRDLYTLQWSAMLILVYFTEGIVRATSDRGFSSTLASIEVVLTTIYFACALIYLRPYKQAARRAKQNRHLRPSADERL